MTDAVTGPFAAVSEQLITWLGDVAEIAIPQDLQWPILLLTLLIATIIWKVRRGHGSKNAEGRERRAGLLEFLLPRDIYTHVSARVDVGLWLLECLLRPLWGLPEACAAVPRNVYLTETSAFELPDQASFFEDGCQCRQTSRSRN